MSDSQPPPPPPRSNRDADAAADLTHALLTGQVEAMASVTPRRGNFTLLLMGATLLLGTLGVLSLFELFGSAPSVGSESTSVVSSLFESFDPESSFTPEASKFQIPPPGERIAGLRSYDDIVRERELIAAMRDAGEELIVEEPQPVAVAAPEPSSVVPASTSSPRVSTKAKQGLLTLVTFPEAEVRYGKRVIGTTPLWKQPLPVGTQSLTLIGPDGARRKFSVRIKEDEPQAFRIDLEALPIAQ